MIENNLHKFIITIIEMRMVVDAGEKRLAQAAFDSACTKRLHEKGALGTVVWMDFSFIGWFGTIMYTERHMYQYDARARLHNWACQTSHECVTISLPGHQSRHKQRANRPLEHFSQADLIVLRRVKDLPSPP